MAERQPRILLVDDEQPIQDLLSYPLRKDGYDVVQAMDGLEAVRLFGEQLFDLVVLDVMLPCSGLRRSFASGQIPGTTSTWLGRVQIGRAHV